MSGMLLESKFLMQEYSASREWIFSKISVIICDIKNEMKNYIVIFDYLRNKFDMSRSTQKKK